MRNSVFELQFFQSSNRRRAKTEVMEEISSQNSDLGLEDLDKLEAKGQAENIKRATSWGIKKFEKWCDKRKLKVDFTCVTPVELKNYCGNSTLKLNQKKANHLHQVL